MPLLYHSCFFSRILAVSVRLGHVVLSCTSFGFVCISDDCSSFNSIVCVALKSDFMTQSGKLCLRKLYLKGLSLLIGRLWVYLKMYQAAGLLSKTLILINCSVVSCLNCWRKAGGGHTFAPDSANSGVKLKKQMGTKYNMQMCLNDLVWDERKPVLFVVVVGASWHYCNAVLKTLFSLSAQCDCDFVEYVHMYFTSLVSIWEKKTAGLIQSFWRYLWNPA